jgi:hypothetical protein
MNKQFTLKLVFPSYTAHQLRRREVFLFGPKTPLEEQNYLTN